MDVIKDKPLRVFTAYAVPAVFGMLAISSATVVDGFFVGNYVGAIGLAAINISMPIFSILFGLALMLAIGASVISGKLMAEGDTKSASLIFSKTVVSIVILSFSIAGLIYLNMNAIIDIFEPPADLKVLVVTYLSLMLIFIPFLMSGIVLDYFVKIDSQPLFAFYALLFSSLINIVLDYLLIVYLEKGLFGAALATGISQASLIFILLPHFFSKRATIRFVKPLGSFKVILHACFNGASEFVNETSVGITTIIFNYIMMQSFGVDGVAAYTVVNYMLWIALMISFGISDSLPSIISKNFGAKETQRMNTFLKYAFISVLISGVLLMSFVLIYPEILVEIFLESQDAKTIAIVIAFLSIVWPVFLFNGSNLVISAYLTSIHKPLPSAIIALTRSLILPVVFILVLPKFLGDNGLYLAIVCAEFFTLIIALYLFKKFRPETLTT